MLLCLPLLTLILPMLYIRNHWKESSNQRTIEIPSYTRNIKNPTVVRQKHKHVSIQSATLGWGHVSPLRRTQWYSRKSLKEPVCPQSFR